MTWGASPGTYDVNWRSPCVASAELCPYSGQVLTLFRNVLLGLFGVFCLLQPSSALTGEECLVVVEAGSVDELTRMIGQHSPEELFRVRDSSGRGLLHHAMKRDSAFLKLMLEAGWPMAKEKGWTPQHEAALLGNLEAMVAIKESGGPLSPKEPHNGGTPLHVAAFNGHFDVVKYLVAEGAEVNARDKEGWTALSQARDQGFPAIVDWLKKNGATR